MHYHEVVALISEMDIRNLIFYSSFKYSFSLFTDILGRVKNNSSVIIFGEATCRKLKKSYENYTKIRPNDEKLFESVKVFKVGKNQNVPFGVLDSSIVMTSPSEVGVSILNFADKLKNEHVFVFGASTLFEIFGDDGFEMLIQMFDYLNDCSLHLFVPLEVKNYQKCTFLRSYFDYIVKLEEFNGKVLAEFKNNVFSEFPDILQFELSIIDGKFKEV